MLPVYRTQGGHRRFKRGEVELWVKTRGVEESIDPASVVQAALRNIRVQISEGRLGEEAWYQKLDDEARSQYRESARTLFGGLVSYLSSGGDEGASEARSIGYEYASRARRFGLSAADAARAFLFFRDALLRSVIEVYQGANVPSGRAWGEVMGAVNHFTDTILLNLLDTYEGMDKRGSK